MSRFMQDLFPINLFCARTRIDVFDDPGGQSPLTTIEKEKRKKESFLELRGKRKTTVTKRDGGLFCEDQKGQISTIVVVVTF